MGIFGSRPPAEPAEGIAGNGLPRESVWDYPRPPRVEPVGRRVRIELGGAVVADVDRGRALRVLETAGAPAVYIPPEEIASGALARVDGRELLRVEGVGRLLRRDRRWRERRERRLDLPRADASAFTALRGYVSFYPALVRCRLDGEVVLPQPGGFYGGWVTAEIAGPIKGEPGSGGW